MRKLRFLGAAILSLVGLGACAPAPNAALEPETTGRRPDAGSHHEGPGGEQPPPGDERDAAIDPDDACFAEGAQATLKREPVDIILIVDNAGSMGRQIASVQENINARFAKVLDDYKLDYRVIVISAHGNHKDDVCGRPSDGHCPICIEAPLSGIPAGGCENPPEHPANTSRFFHYSHRLHRWQSLCVLMETFSNPDQLGRASEGWSQWLREEAFKSFVVISPGRVSCSTGGKGFFDNNDATHAEQMAPRFVDALQELSEEQFGSGEDDRKFRFYNIGTLKPNDPPEMPYLPSDPIIMESCEAKDVNTGAGYQAVSRLTGGARFPFCNPDAFGAVFETIARDVISGVAVDCEFPIPDPPPGQAFQLNRTAVRYTPSDSGEPVFFGPVADASQCGSKDSAFYVEGKTVHLCPATCAFVRGDDAAEVTVLFDCQGVIY